MNRRDYLRMNEIPPKGFALDLTESAKEITARGDDFWAGVIWTGRGACIQLLYAKDASRVGLVWGADAKWFEAYTLDDALMLANRFDLYEAE